MHHLPRITLFDAASRFQRPREQLTKTTIQTSAKSQSVRVGEDASQSSSQGRVQVRADCRGTLHDWQRASVFLNVAECLSFFLSAFSLVSDLCVLAGQCVCVCRGRDGGQCVCVCV